ADQRHGWKVVPLRDHLRADEHVNLALRHVVEHARDFAAAPNRVAIDAGHTSLRERGHDLGLDALGAESTLLEILAAARRARARHGRGVVAIMTAQLPAPSVIRQRHAAMRALHRRTALPAEHDGRVAAAVEEDDGLLAAIEPRANRIHERRA